VDSNRPFPIQGGTLKDKKGNILRPITRYSSCHIPWWLAEAAYEVYSSKYGTDQSLERLASRGGFGREELIWLLGGGKVPI
jgi:hypothetical protein